MGRGSFAPHLFFRALARVRLNKTLLCEGGCKGVALRTFAEYAQVNVESKSPHAERMG